MKKILITIVCILSIITLLGCGISFNDKRVLSNEQWIEDINYLGTELTKQHPDIFKYRPKEKWDDSIDKLKSEVPKLSDIDIKMRIAQIVATLGDAHTAVAPIDILTPIGEKQITTDEIWEFPVKAEYFDDGLRVVQSDSKYKDILGSKLISINNVDIREVLDKIATIIAHDYKNKQGQLFYAKEYMNTYEFLKFFEIVDGKKAEYIFENDNKEKINLKLKPLKNKDIDYIKADVKEMKTNKIPEGESEFFWYKNFKEDNILYFKFNKFATHTNGDIYPNFYEFQEGMIEEINEKDYDKFVIDLRNNKGGNGKVLDAMTDMIKYRTDLSGEDIYVITGKQSNSASTLLAWDLQSKRDANIVGETTGGNINLFGSRSVQIELPNSKFKVAYSNSPIISKKGYIGGVKPDIEIIQSYEDYVNGIDTCYEHIRKLIR
ncbi:S41 family peptidase [Paraclostridium bifermentans]|uniref:S41 family peptidase n=1 Tax=Paraclostridium bifermentans TaxID=1490 RepID=UPI00359CAE1E